LSYACRYLRALFRALAAGIPRGAEELLWFSQGDHCARAPIRVVRNRDHDQGGVARRKE
jgi:hypothetical protein